MTFVVPELAAPLEAFATAIGIGLLIGLERERRPDAAAGLRTFALIGCLGCLFALLGEKTGGPWVLASGLLVIVAAMIAANFSTEQEEKFRGFTSEVAAIATYGLGAAVWYGHATLAVMLGITTTVLLYFKTELHRFSHALTPRDINSVLQFAVLSLVVLPILPSQDMGPYSAFNPRQVWWMVVLISGLALAGYIALRIVGARHGAALLGLFGGMVSSTATTLMFSRHARTHQDLLHLSAVVILIANLMVMLRIALVGTLVAPQLLSALLPLLAAGVVPGIALTLMRWRALQTAGDLPLPEVSNPTELKTALAFGLLYAAVLLAAAWLQDLAGSRGLYAVALASGLTDVDATVLSSLRLFNLEKIPASTACTAIGLTIMANLVFKIGLVISIAGPTLARSALPGLIAIGLGTATGLLLIG